MMIPPMYREPFGLPFRWQDEQSTLPEAVKAYFNRQATEEQIRLVTQYLEYYISAPCWIDNIDRKSTRLNSSHLVISYAVFCLKKKINIDIIAPEYSTAFANASVATTAISSVIVILNPYATGHLIMHFPITTHAVRCTWVRPAI